MIKTIKGAMRSPRYKKQKLFVLTDAGAHFKYRFCVIGIPAEMYRLTRILERKSKLAHTLRKSLSERRISFQAKIGVLKA